ncbi:MAG: hypothetical protein RR770_07670, partial [Bacteroidales bacterium]
QLIESYEQTKEEWLKEYGQKKGAIGLKKDEWKREYDQKRRDLYRIYAAKRNEAVALYNDKKAESIKLFDRKLKELENEIHDYVNSKVNKFSKVAIVKVQQEAFQKTATQKIKRYLYKK